MARHVKHLRRHVPEREDVTVLDGAKRKTGVGGGVEDVLGARGRSQLTASRDVIGVHVRIDDIPQLESRGRRPFEVAFGLPHGVHHRAGGVTGAAEEIRGRDYRSVCRY
jgi:hypothetical protein